MKWLQPYGVALHTHQSLHTRALQQAKQSAFQEVVDEGMSRRDAKLVGRSWVEGLQRVRLEQMGLNITDVWAISELFAFCGEMPRAQEHAVGWLLLFYSALQSQGSTCFSLEEMFPPGLSGIDASELDFSEPNVSGSALQPLGASALNQLGASAKEIEEVYHLVADLVAFSDCDSQRAPQPYDSIIGHVGERKPLVLEGPYLFSEKNWWFEKEIGEKLQERIHSALPEKGMGQVGRRRFDLQAIDAAIEDVLACPAELNGKPIRISKEQVEAIRGCFRKNFFVLTGGPGTGKTSFVVSLLRVLCRLDTALVQKTVLCAPTGKAADRMQRSIVHMLSLVRKPSFADLTLIRQPPSAHTIHRLLGYSQSRGVFRHHQDNPLMNELVIVDEASMIDLALMQKLVRALSPKSSVLLVGDAEQLPPVGQGAVFRDLVAVPHAAMRLTKNFRVKTADKKVSPILQLSDSIRCGGRISEAQQSTYVKRDLGDLSFEGVEMFSPTSPEEVTGFLETWYGKWIQPWIESELVYATVDIQRDGTLLSAEKERVAAVFEALEKQKVLCVDRKSMFGVQNINAWFHERLKRFDKMQVARPLDNTSDAFDNVADMDEGSGQDWLLGEPVMVTQNDYGLGLFNGDQGVVVLAREGSNGSQVGGRTVEQLGKWVVFSSTVSVRLFPLVRVQSLLERSFAMTVHKAQGSEAEHVAIILPLHFSPLMTRELVYTAVTRAKQSVSVVGNLLHLQRAAQNPVKRLSRLHTWFSSGKIDCA